MTDALGRQQAVGQLLCHPPVEFVHRDRPALAGGFALLRTGGASVVAVAAGLVGAQRHAALAAGAGGNTCQTGHGARRRRFRIAGLERRLDAVERISVDDGTTGIAIKLCFGLQDLALSRF